MKSFSIMILATLVGCPIVRAQNAQLAVNVYKPVPGTMSSAKTILEWA